MGSESKKLEAVGISEKLKEIAKLSLDRLPVLSSIFENLAIACVERFRDYCAPVFSAFVNQLVSGDSWTSWNRARIASPLFFIAANGTLALSSGSIADAYSPFSKRCMAGREASCRSSPPDPSRPSKRKSAAWLANLPLRLSKKPSHRWRRSLCCSRGLKSALEFTSLGQNSMMMIEAKILFQVLDQGGVMYVLIPQNAMNPIRQKLERERRAAPPSQDPRWTNALNSRVSKAEVVLNAVMDGKNLELDELLKLGPGKTFSLTGTDQSVIVECEGDRLFRGRLGQARGVFTITIEEPINDEVYADDGPPSDGGGN